MATDYYTHGSTPSTGSPGSSSTMRAEFDLIEAGFSKLPSLTGNGNRAVIVNAGGSALTLTTGTIALSGAFVTSGAFATSGGHSVTLTSTGTTNVTLPTTGTLVTRTATETLTNKTITAPVLSGSITGTYTLAGTPTISSPALSGTVTGTYTLAGTPTISSPALSGTVTGTYTLAGTPTITGPTISDPTITGVVDAAQIDLTSGITFPASGVGSPDSNFLNMYEVGDWTPSIGGTATYTSRVGRYIKIGKLVFIYGTIVVNSRGTGSQSTISGLPFTTANKTFGVLSVSKTSSFALSVVSVHGVFSVFTTEFLLYTRTAAATSDAINNVIGNGTTFSFAGCYEAVS